MPRALELQGLHAYAEKIMAAGETVRFRVSSTVPYGLSVCRLGWGVDDPAGDRVLATLPKAPPVGQPIHPGSFVYVEKALPADEALEALSLECWVRPWRVKGWQTLVSQYDYPTACGLGLFLGAEGHVQFYLGDGGAYREDLVHTGPQLVERRWHHVACTWDGKTKSLFVDGKPAGAWPFAGPVKPGPAPLRLAGCGYDGPTVNLLDGDLAGPVIYGRALSAEEVAERFERKGLEPAAGEGVLAFWPLNEERGERIADASGNARHGRIVNCGTWMIGGPSFDGSKVPRYGEYDPAEDPRRGHGLRFASDDLYDCRWQVTHEVRIPKTARPGLYVGRFEFEIDGVPRLYHVTFVVKKAPDARKAPILVIASTNSWLAYSATAFAVTPPGTHYHWGTEGITNGPGNPPAYCMYRNHRAGQPAYKVGVNRPWPNAGPYVLYASGGAGYSHLIRAERFALVWLEKNGYPYDIVGDWDVQHDPDLLAGYKTVLINGHGEYWSTEEYQALDRYLCQGGNAVVLSGNVGFWRVSFNPEGTVMECRKFDPALGGRPGASVGELWHGQDGRRGSLTRECGMPAWKLIGLSTFGWGGIGPESFGLLSGYNPSDYFARRTEISDRVVAQMIYWERPQGGRVFHAGSLGSGWGLSADPKMQTLLRNVLYHFGVKPAAGEQQ